MPLSSQSQGWRRESQETWYGERWSWVKCLSENHDNISRLVGSLARSHSLTFLQTSFTLFPFGIIFHSASSSSSTHIRATVCCFALLWLSYDLKWWEHFPIFFFYYNIIKQNTFEWCLISVLFFPFFGAIRFGTAATARKKVKIRHRESLSLTRSLLVWTFN